MNKSQQLVLAITIPIICLTLGYGFTTTLTMESGKYKLLGLGEQYINVEWNNFQETWWVWLVTIIVIAILEYFVFHKSSE